MENILMSFQVVLLCFVMVVTSSVNKHSFLNERTKHETSESEESPLASNREDLEPPIAPPLHLILRDTNVNSTVEPENVTENITTTEEPGYSFEDYEKLYFINSTLYLLKQMFCYSEYQASLQNSDTIVKNQPMSMACGSEDDGSRVDDFIERKSRELSDMTVLQLDSLFHNVKHAAKEGADHVTLSSLCCSVG